MPELCPSSNSVGCDNTLGNYTCHCVKGFHGRQCQYNVNDCHGHQCINGATCIDLIDEYHCACRPGFSGKSTLQVSIFFCIIINVRREELWHYLPCCRRRDSSLDRNRLRAVDYVATSQRLDSMRRAKTI